MNRKFAVTALLLCMTLALSGCGKKTEPVEAQVQEKVTSVETLAVSKSTIENKFTYSGKVEPKNDAQVFSLVTGKIKSVNFDVGDKVQKGDVLFQMDTEATLNSINVQKAALAAAEANIQQAQTSLELANGTSMQSQIDAAKAALANAEIAYNNAKTTYDNNKVLFDSGIISKSDMDSIQMALDRAKVTYDQAQESYNLTANEMPAENIKRAQEALNVATASRASYNAQIASLQKTLRDSTVTSPLTGVVTACNVVAGTVLSQSAPAFTIIDTSVVDIDVKASEQIINFITPGQEVDVKISSISSTPIKAKVATVNPAADQTGTYAVKVEIDNADGKLKAGMLGEVSFVKEKKENVIVVPRDVVITKNEEDYVFIDENGIAKKVVVTLGIDNGDKIEIVNGLEENMNVITKGQTYLSEGDKIQLASNAQKEE